LASNFNNDMNDTTNDPILPRGAHAAESSGVPSGVSGSVSSGVPSGVASAVDDTPAEPANVAVPPAAVPPAAVSAAVIKFRSCRWRRPPEDGTECCGHRDVLPMAGTNSFDAEAWCPDCTYFKLRRTPKKRDDSYRY
jgi:hypothetical protein